MDCKVNCADIASVSALEAHGFTLIDTQVTFERSITLPLPQTDTRIRTAAAADKKAVRSLAEAVFTGSRFHLDPQISKATAAKLKGAWAENFFDGKRGEQMAVAEIDGQIVAFNQLLFRDDALVIDLIGVDERHRGSGIAEALVLSSLRLVPSFQSYRVGTQISNTRSIRFYERLGFRQIASSYIFHYHHKG